ncbi:hypothetical protein Q6247_26055, partial [Klebsiella pneumoniae]
QKKQNLEKLLEKLKLRSSIKRMEEEQRERPEKPDPLFDYDRQITKQVAHNKRKKSGKCIPQLGEQANQLVALLMVQSDWERNLLEFSKD